MLKQLTGVMLIAVFGMLFATSSANAVSTATFDASIGTFTNWVVDGVSQGHQLTYYVDTGSGPQALGVGATSIVVTPLAFNETKVTYTYSSFTAVLQQKLTCVGAGAPATLLVQASVTNTSLGTLGVNLFEFANLDLANTPNNDQLTPPPPGGGTTVTQTDGVPEPYDAAFLLMYSTALSSGNLPPNASASLPFSITITPGTPNIAAFSLASGTGLVNVGFAGVRSGDAADLLLHPFALPPVTPGTNDQVTSINDPSQPIPEPATAGLGLLALAGLTGLVTSRRRTHV